MRSALLINSMSVILMLCHFHPFTKQQAITNLIALLVSRRFDGKGHRTISYHKQKRGHKESIPSVRPMILSQQRLFRLWLVTLMNCPKLWQNQLACIVGCVTHFPICSMLCLHLFLGRCGKWSRLSNLAESQACPAHEQHTTSSPIANGCNMTPRCFFECHSP